MPVTQTAETLNDLLQVVRDGREFYEWAGQQPVGPELRSVFRDLENAKSQLIAELAGIVARRGETPASDGTFAGAMHELYAKVRAGLTSDKQKVLVGQLEEAEDRILHSFEDARADAAENPELRGVIERYLPRVRANHDRMKLLKDSYLPTEHAVGAGASSHDAGFGR